jgi:hypothetical protein
MGATLAGASNRERCKAIDYHRTVRRLSHPHNPATALKLW